MAIRALDQFNFHRTLAQTRGVSLVYFTSPACGACKLLRSILDSHPEAFAQFSLFEVDAEREMALTNEFDVFHLPSIFLYHNGEYHAALHAEPLPHAIIAAVESALAAPAMEAP